MEWKKLISHTDTAFGWSEWYTRSERQVGDKEQRKQFPLPSALFPKPNCQRATDASSAEARLFAAAAYKQSDTP